MAEYDFKKAKHGSKKLQRATMAADYSSLMPFLSLFKLSY